jgi:hypothetical protein
MGGRATVDVRAVAPPQPTATMPTNRTADSRLTNDPGVCTLSFETRLYDTDGHVATITLNRPDRLNTIVPPMPDDSQASLRRSSPR